MKATILLIGDNSVIRDSLSHTLRSEGCEVTLAVPEKPLDLPLLLGVVERARAGTSAARGRSTRAESL